MDNSTLVPIPSLDFSGLALQTATTQFHTHVNFRFPDYINESQCMCQLAFHTASPADGAGNAQVDLFELDAPTNGTHHPSISGYQGRWIARQLITGTGVALTEFGIQPFDCSSLKMGGLLVGYEVAPKWWDDTASVDVRWSGKLSIDLLQRLFTSSPCLAKCNFCLLCSMKKKGVYVSMYNTCSIDSFNSSGLCQGHI